MSIVLYRVDERLIHGQVVVGWGSTLRPARVIVADDQLATSSWEQELYGLGLPDGVEPVFLTVEEARARLADWRAEATRSILLVRDLDAVLALARDDAMRGEEVNIGGIHYAPGRSRILPYLFLNEHEREVIRELMRRGVKLSARDLPGARRVGAEELVGDLSEPS